MKAILKGKPHLLSLPISHRFSTYFAKKAAMQKLKIANSFLHDPKRLIPLNLSMKQLSPNFFAKCLPIYETSKTFIQDKQSNVLDNSYIAADVAVSTDPEIQLNMKKFSSYEVRIGRLMELMDSIAGMVGYRHCFGSLTSINPFVLVTGSVDSINFFEKVTVHHDLRMEGYITSVGKTSMEIEINLHQEGRLKCNTLFTMISRNSADHLKSYNCPALNFSNLPPGELEKAIKRSEEGEKNKERRKKEMKQSYQNCPPNPSDIKILHNLFLSNRNQPQSPEGISIEHTKISNTIIMHTQERNVHNKIFGGYLMREMLDTAWMAGNKFTSGREFQIEDITNVYFRNPVEIGDELRVVAKVSYTQAMMMVVSVEAYTVNYALSRNLLCSECHIFMRGQGEQPKVYPLSYENGIHYLSSKNTYEKIFK